MRESERHPVPSAIAFLVGAACGGIVVGLWALLYQVRLTTFPPFDLADLIIRYSPGDLATWAIETFGHNAQRLLLASGVVVWVAVWEVLSLAGATRRGRQAILPATILLLVAAFGLAWWSESGLSASRAIWLLLAFGAIVIGAGLLLSRWLEGLASAQREIAEAPSGATWLDHPGTYRRRDILRQAGTLALVLGAGGTLSGWLLKQVYKRDMPTAAGASLDTLRTVPATPDVSEASVPPTPIAAPPLPKGFNAPPGVRDRITSNPEFYRVDISTRAPSLVETDWTLTIKGLVEQETTLTWTDLLAMPAIEQYATLMCISFTYGSDLISTTRWTGVRLRDVLQRVGIGDGVVDVVCRGAGEYSDSIPLAKALEPTTLLVYGMNGDALPQKHGFPCRLYVANLYGEKNVKWLQEIELVNTDYLGFWQERGWSDTAMEQITSIIDTPHGETTPSAGGSIPVAGIAFAGSRGITSVEVRADDGEWQPATVEPYDPALIWQRWRLDWLPTPGPDTLTVRATDGTGTLQTATESDPHPEGMTGYHTVKVTIV
jgi:DMSO/TMAO reductase YedYZ molybdopterin-dependent catalytic subunit